MRLLIFISFFLSLNCRAASCLELMKTLLDSQIPAVSIEMETSFASGMLMPLLTTSNGKVGALFEGRPLPEFFTQAFPTNPREVSWDQLPTHQRIKLLNSISATRGTTFEQDRVIHGLRIKSSREFQFKEEISFMGTIYPPGTHQIELGQYFGEIEYASSTDLKKFRAIELHFRADQDASELFANGRAFVKMARLDTPNFHMHIVANIPFDALEKNPVATSLALANLYRRSDLALEFIDTIFLKNSPATSTFEGIIYQDASKPHFLGGIANYFYQISQGDISSLHDLYKKGWAGFHGSGKYDNRNFWGIQFRQLLDDQKEQHLEPLLQATQSRMRGDLKEEVSQISFWTKKMNIDENNLDFMNQLHYNREWEELIENSDVRIKRVLTTQGLDQSLKPFAQEQYALKMLVHDWSNDPLLLGNKVLQKRIRNFQISALEKIAAINAKEDYHYQLHLAEIVSEFLQESGLAKTVFNSLGVNSIL